MGEGAALGTAFGWCFQFGETGGCRVVVPKLTGTHTISAAGTHKARAPIENGRPAAELSSDLGRIGLDLMTRIPGAPDGLAERQRPRRRASCRPRFGRPCFDS